MFDEIRANQRRTVVLVTAMALLLVAMGYVFAESAQPGAGVFGVVIAIVIWIFMSLISYFQGDSIFLTLSRAKRIEKKDHPVLFNVVEEMCVASGIPQVPAIYIMDEKALNAFATGRDYRHASVAVTSGLLENLNRDELQGVIAHELGHVKNRDILYIMMLGVMLGTIILIADAGRRFMRFGSYTRTAPRRGKGSGQLQMIMIVLAILLMILAPVIARLLYLAVSRRREYLADASSALYTRFPDGLANALEKLSGSSEKLQGASQAMAPMYIVNPLVTTAGRLSDLSSTHPPISQRVRILRAMGGENGLRAYDEAARSVTGRPVGLLAFVETKELTPSASPPRPLLPVAVANPDSHPQRVRTTTDLLWKLNQYVFIACECGTNLKVPPHYQGQTVACPHCEKAHSVSTLRRD